MEAPARQKSTTGDCEEVGRRRRRGAERRSLDSEKARKRFGGRHLQALVAGQRQIRAVAMAQSEMALLVVICDGIENSQTLVLSDLNSMSRLIMGVVRYLLQIKPTFSRQRTSICNHRHAESYLQIFFFSTTPPSRQLTSTSLPAVSLRFVFSFLLHSQDDILATPCPPGSSCLRLWLCSVGPRLHHRLGQGPARPSGKSIFPIDFFLTLTLCLGRKFELLWLNTLIAELGGLSGYLG
jgi:hypothetical protein